MLRDICYRGAKCIYVCLLSELMDVALSCRYGNDLFNLSRLMGTYQACLRYELCSLVFFKKNLCKVHIEVVTAQ